MSTISIKALENLLDSLKTNTQEALSPDAAPVVIQMIEETEEMSEKLKKATSQLNIEQMGIQDVLGTIQDLDRSRNSASQSKDGVKVNVKSLSEVNNILINTLVKICDSVVEKLNAHSTILGALVDSHKKELVEVKEEATKEKEKSVELKNKIERLETDYDEVRQRSMKGNLIVSSPKKEGIDTLLVKKQHQDEWGNFWNLETETQTVIRVVAEKTGVWFNEREVQACHTLNKQRTSFILRISDLKPGSNWDILQQGMLSGVNQKDNQNFVRNNVFLSHQLTKRRLDFVQEVVKVAKQEQKITSYCSDQNGVTKVSLDRGRGKKWLKVSSKEELDEVISNGW